MDFEHLAAELIEEKAEKQAAKAAAEKIRHLKVREIASALSKFAEKRSISVETSVKQDKLTIQREGHGKMFVTVKEDDTFFAESLEKSFDNGSERDMGRFILEWLGIS
ncbi:MAG: hypothetical protein ABI024_01400 [Vicinamibacterales bacterium]